MENGSENLPKRRSYPDTKNGSKRTGQKRVKDIWIRELSNFKGISLT